MNREFIELPEFINKWKELGLDDDNLCELEEYLCDNPKKGKVIKGTGGLRKLRWNLKTKGKSGGIRTLYIDFTFYEKIYLVTVYPKSNKDSLTDDEKKNIKNLITILIKENKGSENSE